ncbi:MAG TPA: TIGR00159 family protein [Candidatus Fimihabitans intestinipullorum]|uniref:Diadenylate cyclase n=1 Tax=Candidatus Fimihabitans intestinipullorum TaxID=2840820 RepID=A0A9D1L3K6_9BACT|nr:TIGR00159 family protein [Candidatus Fimihabitans intestinipullorum]
MTFDSIVLFARRFLDVLLVWLVLYYMLKSLRKNVKMVLLFKGILFIVILKIISDVLNLVTIGYLLDYVIMWGPLAIIIIFQPEIRTVLEQLGRSQLLGRHKVLTVDEREKIVYEIMQAVEYLKRARIGALIVIERDNSLVEYIEKSKKIYADISSELLISLFFPNNPMHDGGVIIQGDKITSAGAVFPTSDNLKISKRLGTRHRAALGISEETDCIALIVSEETGRISIAIGGELNYNLTLDEFKLMLLDELRPKKALILEEEDEETDEMDK